KRLSPSRSVARVVSACTWRRRSRPTPKVTSRPMTRARRQVDDWPFLIVLLRLSWLAIYYPVVVPLVVFVLAIPVAFPLSYITPRLLSPEIADLTLGVAILVASASPSDKRPTSHRRSRVAPTMARKTSILPSP